MSRLNRNIFALLLLIGSVLGVITYTTYSGKPEARAADATDAAFSLAELPTKWRDQAGNERTLTGDVRDERLSVVTMLYTSCTVSCPRLIADLKRVEGGLTEAQRREVEFIVVSIDPARDTPARLAQFATDLHLDAARWTLLTGTEAGVRELAAVLRVRYQAEPSGEFAHSNRIVVLNAAAEPIHWQAGLGGGVPGTVDAITTELARPR